MTSKQVTAIVTAREALWQIQNEAGIASFSGEDNATGHARLAGTASVAHDILNSVLIAAKVYANDEVAETALRRD